MLNICVLTFVWILETDFSGSIMSKKVYWYQWSTTRYSRVQIPGQWHTIRCNFFQRLCSKIFAWRIRSSTLDVRQRQCALISLISVEKSSHGRGYAPDGLECTLIKWMTWLKVMGVGLDNVLMWLCIHWVSRIRLKLN